MAPEVLELMKPLVDVQPAYNLMHVGVAGDDSDFPPEVRAMARHKLREAAKTLRETARYIDRKLAEAKGESA